jgi:hypothetical protein
MWVLPKPASLNLVTQSVRQVLRRHRRSWPDCVGVVPAWSVCQPTQAADRRPGRAGSRETATPSICGWPESVQAGYGATCSEQTRVGKETEIVGKVRTRHSTSLDGFIAGPNDGPEAPMGEGGERLLGWYFGGDTEYRLPGTEMVFKVAPQTAELLRETRTTTGALVTRRRTFDITHGWGGRHPLDVPVFVVTHQA